MCKLLLPRKNRSHGYKILEIPAICTPAYGKQIRRFAGSFGIGLLKFFYEWADFFHIKRLLMLHQLIFGIGAKIICVTL